MKKKIEGANLKKLEHKKKKNFNHKTKKYFFFNKDLTEKIISHKNRNKNNATRQILK